MVDQEGMMLVMDADQPMFYFVGYEEESMGEDIGNILPMLYLINPRLIEGCHGSE